MCVCVGNNSIKFCRLGSKVFVSFKMPIESLPSTGLAVLNFYAWLVYAVAVMNLVTPVVSNTCAVIFLQGCRWSELGHVFGVVSAGYVLLLSYDSWYAHAKEPYSNMLRAVAMVVVEMIVYIYMPDLVAFECPPLNTSTVISNAIESIRSMY